MSAITPTSEPYTGKRNYEGYATVSDSHHSKKRHKIYNPREPEVQIPSDESAQPLFPKSISDRRVDSAFHSIALPPTVERSSLLSYYEEHATVSDSHPSKKRLKFHSDHNIEVLIPSAESAEPLLPKNICDRRVASAFHSIASPPAVQRNSLLSYAVPPLSRFTPRQLPTTLPSSGKDSLADSESQKSFLESSKQSDLQRMGAAYFNSRVLTDEELQKVISTLFIQMAKKIPSSDKNATFYPELALKLDPEENVKARLLMTLGNAYFKKIEVAPTGSDSITKAISYYKEGRVLSNIPNNMKAVFSLNLGNAYLSRKNPGDTYKAITSFNEGLKYETRDSKLKSDLLRGKDNAFTQSLRHPSSSSRTK